VKSLLHILLKKIYVEDGRERKRKRPSNPCRELVAVASAKRFGVEGHPRKIAPSFAGRWVAWPRIKRGTRRASPRVGQKSGAVRNQRTFTKKKERISKGGRGARSSRGFN